MPQPGELERLLRCIGYQYVWREGSRVGLSRPGVELDFGGFGRQYAVDRAVSLLQDAGVRHGVLNLAGDLRRPSTSTFRPSRVVCRSFPSHTP